MDPGGRQMSLDKMKSLTHMVYFVCGSLGKEQSIVQKQYWVYYFQEQLGHKISSNKQIQCRWQDLH